LLCCGFVGIVGDTAVKTERPRQSKFMGHVYKIRYLPAGSIKNKEGEELNGETDNQKNTIDIEEGMMPSKERVIILHETVHQIFDSLAIEIPEDLEEALVTHLGMSLGAHIADNPLFWRYICRRLKPPKEP
jgi:hypothetical protein